MPPTRSRGPSAFRWVGRLAEVGASGRGKCSLMRRPRGLRKEVVTLKSFSKTTESPAKLICSQETLALTPADLVKSRGQPSAWRPRCCARSVAYPGASLKGQCGRPSLSRRPVHQSLYRARERRESRVPFGPHPLRGYKALDSRHSLAVWPSKKPAASPVLAGPGASPAKVETPEPLAKASTIEIHRPPLRARLAPTLWKNPGEGRRLKEVVSWMERPALLRDS